MKKSILTLCAALLMLTGCGQTGGKEGEYRKITQAEAQAMMGEDVVVLDVRSQEEYAAGHIPKALLLPDTELKQRVEELLPDKTQTILVYCRSGRRSASAAKLMVELGYTEVYDFGGILDWTGEIIK